MNVKMIATDLDCTLLRTDKTVSEYTVNVLSRCRERGIKLVFVTARPPSMVKEFTDVLSPDAVCVNNGSCIFIECNPPVKFFFEQETQRSLLRELSRNDSFYRISAQTGEKDYTSTADTGYKTYMDFTQETDERFGLIAFHYRNIKEVARVLQPYRDIRYHFVSGTDLVDIFPEHASKISSIKIVAAHWGINVANIAAFGDDYNDIDLLRECGIGVAVENAIDEAKAAANYICDSNDNDGMAKWIEANIL